MSILSLFIFNLFINQQKKNTILKFYKIDIKNIQNINLKHFLKYFKKSLNIFKIIKINLLNIFDGYLNSLLKKDSLLLLNLFKFIIENSNYKNHKSIVRFFFLLFSFFKNHYKYLLNILGLKVIITGKLGLTGNSKTKKLLFQIEKSSLNNKNLKLDYSRTNIKSKSGAIGIKLFIIY